MNLRNVHVEIHLFFFYYSTTGNWKAVADGCVCAEFLLPCSVIPTLCSGPLTGLLYRESEVAITFHCKINIFCFTAAEMVVQKSIYLFSVVPFKTRHYFWSNLLWSRTKVVLNMYGHSRNRLCAATSFHLVFFLSFSLTSERVALYE